MFSKWRSPKASNATSTSAVNSVDEEKAVSKPRRWNLGIMSDSETDEVPGSVILLSHGYKRNEPLGLQHAHARNSSSSLPSPYPRSASRQSSRSRAPEKKRTKDGKFVLDPQPDDSANDPLNWPALRRDAALLSLGFYCMVGGGMTPILAAGFNNVADTYNVSVPEVALTTGLYMMGLGIGSVIMSPTAILFGKRPVYLVAIVLFLLSSVWCALSPNYASLVIARIVMGIAVSPCECLPSASVAEIFFLHERAYRLGIYTLLLLGGKNLIPLVSAVIIQSLGWRWVFWIVAIVVGFCFFLLFLFVPETFWDRTPHRRRSNRSRSVSPARRRRPFPPRLGSFAHSEKASPGVFGLNEAEKRDPLEAQPSPTSGSGQKHAHKDAHVGFAEDTEKPSATEETPAPRRPRNKRGVSFEGFNIDTVVAGSSPTSPQSDSKARFPVDTSPFHEKSIAEEEEPQGKVLLPTNAPIQSGVDAGDRTPSIPGTPALHSNRSMESVVSDPQSFIYTEHYRSAPPKSYVQSLKPWNGRLAKDPWYRVAVRPFILFAYPAVLWSTLVYSLSVGWLIVLSESVSTIYKARDTYNFTSLQAGLVYLSPFIGGVLGTAVAGKVSDIIVRSMAKRNDGVYEPEFRLVMAIPIAISTTIGLMGFGWSAAEKDNYMVPTVFFGVISFGCSLGSTTAITFCVDSYRQYAGEALVTLNFSKNIFHGLVFSLFFTHWLESDGSKTVFLSVGGIQIACLLFTIPMYIYGKRARMWTVRKNLMEKF